MMVRFYSRAARRNLKKGAEKMESEMSVAARVRRQFRQGRPPKVGESLPLHPRVVWDRAFTALSRFRTLLSIEKLEPMHVSAAIVFIQESAPDQPHLLLLEIDGSVEECKSKVLEQLGRPDAIAIGMIFRQFDADAKEKKQTTFPYQFVGLNERGIDVLKKAVRQTEQRGAFSA
jgi:hypothetical protein